MLKPGALYAECAVVPLHVPATSVPPIEKKSEGGEDKDKNTLGDEGIRPDDGELGGVALGMQVWDEYEQQLKVWEAAREPISALALAA